MSETPESIWIDRGPNGGWMFRTEKLHDSVKQYVPADRIEQLTAEVERLREALRVMIYETTHLSPMEPDGSHWCRITADALNTARAALGESHD